MSRKGEFLAGDLILKGLVWLFETHFDFITLFDDKSF